MKKLFVLFLLVALVPFTVGCSLWGSDDDDNVGYPTFLTATVKVPAAGVANLRAASYADFSSYTLTLNGIVLSVDEASSVFTTDPVTLVFKALATQAQINSVQSSTVPFTAVLSNGAGSSTTLTINPSGATGAVSITVNATGDVTSILVGTTDVINYVGEGTFTITSVKLGEEVLPTTSTATPATAASLLPVFTVTLPANIDATADLVAVNGLNVTATNAAGNAVVLAATDFTVAQAAANSFTVTVKPLAEPKVLTNGTTYKVTIKNLKNDGKVVVPTTYYFKVVLPQ